MVYIYASIKKPCLFPSNINGLKLFNYCINNRSIIDSQFYIDIVHYHAYTQKRQKEEEDYQKEKIKLRKVADYDQDLYLKALEHSKAIEKRARSTKKFLQSVNCEKFSEERFRKSSEEYFDALDKISVVNENTLKILEHNMNLDKDLFKKASERLSHEKAIASNTKEVVNARRMVSCLLANYKRSSEAVYVSAAEEAGLMHEF